MVSELKAKLVILRGGGLIKGFTCAVVRHPLSLHVKDVKDVVFQRNCHKSYPIFSKQILPPPLAFPCVSGDWELVSTRDKREAQERDDGNERRV